jgi:hypothetical protein
LVERRIPTMKEEHRASRTLVKSAPELWAECSVAASLTRHLGQFGEIKITRLEPETAVAWEGGRASGTVRLEPSGWGTQVTLTARAAEAEPVSAPEPAVTEVLEEEQHEEVVEEPEPEAPEPEPEPDPEPRAVEPEPLAVQAQRKGMFARLRRLFARSAPAAEFELGARSAPAVELESPPVPEPPRPEVAPQTEPATTSDVVQRSTPARVPADPETVLAAALDSLGQAHHRPFSRA